MLDKKYFKNQIAHIRSQYLHPAVAEIMAEMVEWLSKKKVTPIITETVTTLTEDAQRRRRSATHREGRAFDIRTRDWPEPLIKEFEIFFNKKYGVKGAIAPVSLQPTLLLHHDTGLGDHFHVQFSKSFAVVVPLDLEPKVLVTVGEEEDIPKKHIAPQAVVQKGKKA